MKAFYVTDVGKTEIREAGIPAIADDGVLIKVEYAGICGSDFHIFTGRHEYRRPPVIPGHELSGRVEAIGRAVRNLRPGDQVTVLPQATCGECRFCRAGRPMLCRSRVVPGTDKWIGSFVEHFNAPESVVFRLPDSLPMKTAVLAEPLAVACHCLGRIPETNRSGLLIHGAGSIGLLALAAAKKRGFGRIAATDVIDYNLEKALELGADAGINARKDSLVDACREIFGPDGPTAVLFTAGGEPALQASLDLADHGATIVYVAMILEPMSLATRPIVAKELDLVGSRTYGRTDFEAALALLAEDQPLFDSLITHVFPLRRAGEGFDLMASRREGFVKILVDMDTERNS